MTYVAQTRLQITTELLYIQLFSVRIVLIVWRFCSIIRWILLALLVMPPDGVFI